MGSKMKYSFLVFLAIALMLFLSCTTYPTPTAPSSVSLLVPQRADLIAGVEIQQMLNDGDFAYLYRRFAAANPDMPRTVNDALDQVTAETGIDPRDFRQAVAFANTSDLVQSMGSPYLGEPYWGALLKGSFAEKRMILAISDLFSGEFETHRYKGAKIYTFTEGQEALFSVTFVNNELMVVGSTRAVEDTIDVMVGDKQPISGVVYDLYQSLGSAFLKIAFSVPPSISAEIPATEEIDDFHLTLRPLRDVDMAGYAFSKIGSTTITEVELHCAYADSAQEIEELVRDLLGLGRLLVLDPELKHHLDHVEATTYGSVFSLRITETIAEIEDLIELLSGL